ncbi:MFS transporter [Rhizomonospora bruguierae]|uniref:MFS transporter n=1 Tax=Rhizomonospora bruguierae TaxID=1581705 RepID=UPI001BD09C45|nr:MFS transporter [Micromonospora sp. NBRC 107566]
MVFAVAGVAGKLTGKHGASLPMTIGYTLVGASLLGMLVLRPDTPYGVTAILFLVNGIGQGLAITPATAAVLHIVPPQRAGIAAATVSAARQSDTALGIAVLGALGHAQLAERGSTNELTGGLHIAMLVGGIVALLAALALGMFLRPGHRIAREAGSARTGDPGHRALRT